MGVERKGGGDGGSWTDLREEGGGSAHEGAKRNMVCKMWFGTGETDNMVCNMKFVWWPSFWSPGGCP